MKPALTRGELARMLSLALLLLCLPAFAHATIYAQSLITGLTAPIYVATPPGNPNQVFVVERAGRIRIFQLDPGGNSGTLLSTAFLNISSLTTTDGERGLLSMAFHPQYASNGRFFLYYTNTSGNIVLAEYQRSAADPNVANASGTILLTIPHPTYSNHNGGTVAFGPDGYLYMGTGDGGSAGDPSGNAQNTNSLLGKILRLDVSTTGTYTIPPTNPFASSAGADEIFAYGLRNPFRFSFDRTAGTLFLGDVGQGAWEEVDIITNGANYGWNVMEGNVCYNATTCNTSGKTLPITVYGHTNGNYSITGGCMYRGTQMPSQAGRYIFGDYGSGRIWSLQQTGPSTWTPTELFVIGSAGTVGLVAFGEDTNGELYAVGISNGTVYRLKDTAGVADFDLYQ